MNKTKLLNDWLTKNAFDCTTKKGKYFSYSYIDELITWTNNKTEHDDHFMSFIRHLGYKGNLDLRTISFLHEIGHCEMDTEYTDFDFEVDKLRDLLQGECTNKFTLWLRANIYYRLPMEYKATKWALSYIRSYGEDVNELDMIFRG